MNQIKSQNLKIDYLINNAGILVAPGSSDDPADPENSIFNVTPEQMATIF